jgi:hypothetical protein
MTRRRLLPFLVVVLLAAAGLSGCIAIQQESTSTRLPGVVTISLKICAADRSVSTSTCFPSPTPTPGGVQIPPNTAEGDNGDDNVKPTPPAVSTGQLLIGFRVPAGTVAPATFTSPTGDLFSGSPSYTADLQRDHPAPAGFEWHGYISTKATLTNGADLTSFSVEFGLPAGTGGAPFAGPFQWLAVVGSRGVSDTAPADAPVDCTSTGIAPPALSCYDSPSTTIGGAINAVNQVARPVSDFRVLPGTGATAAPGQAATVSFPVRYSDNATPKFNPQTFKLSGSSTLPGNPAVTPATPNLTMAAGATPTVNETVTVPPGTPPGNYPVTLTAADGATNPVLRSNTATLTVVDKTAPTISIGSPTDGEVLTVGQKVAASYSCADEAGGSGLATCAGPVPSGAFIDTSSPGSKTFTVSATDKAGNAASLTRTYTVAALPRKTLNVSLTFLYAAGRKSTKFTALTVKGVPTGSTVSVKCVGRHCPAKSFKKKNAKGSVSLKPYLKKPLKAGLKLTVTVSKPGFVSMIKTITIRPSKAPKIVTTCLAPGAKKAKSCS